MLRLALVFAILAGAVPAAAQPAAPATRDARNPLAVIERWKIEDLAARVPETASVVASLRLSAVLVRDTDWTREAALEAITTAARILAQCGVRVRSVEFQLVEAPRAYRMLYTPVSRELAAALRAPKPAVFFVQDTLNQPEFEAEAFGRANSRTRPELTDSVWLTARLRDQGIALAHELAHVLMDQGDHVAEAGNLMRAETEPGNTRLTRAQCARLVTTGIAYDLLEEVPRPRRGTE